MLPAHSNPHSRTLAQVARSIAARAPSMPLEIILDGSVARGLADQFSDIELEFFSEHVPSTDEMRAWMQSAGFTGTFLVRLDEAGTKLINADYDGVRVELTWSSFAYEAAQLDGIMERIGGSQFINAPYKWSDALALRTGTHIARWQALFSQYPDAVRHRYIQPVLDEWRSTLTDPIDTAGRWKEAYRHAWFYLLKTHWMDVLPLLRVIFAFNRVWEPVAKWWHAAASNLTYQPENLVERVNDALSNPDPVARIDGLSRLQIETLHLIKAEYEVQDIIEGCVAVREYGLKMADRQ